LWGLCWQGAFTARVDLDRAACRAFERAVFRNPAVGLTAAEDGTAPRVRDQASADEEDQPLLTTPPAARVPRLCRRRLCVVSPSSCPNEPVNVTASSNSFSRSRWIIRPRSSPACRPRSHRLSRILWPSAPGRPASRSVSRSSTSRLRPPCRSKPGPSPPPLGQSLGSGYRGAVP
jgi:hypothetical protein